MTAGQNSKITTLHNYPQESSTDTETAKGRKIHLQYTHARTHTYAHSSMKDLAVSVVIQIQSNWDSGHKIWGLKSDKYRKTTIQPRKRLSFIKLSCQNVTHTSNPSQIRECRTTSMAKILKFPKVVWGKITSWNFVENGWQSVPWLTTLLCLWRTFA